MTRRRFDAEPGVHIKLDKRGDGVAPVEGETVQVNYSGRVKGKKTEFDKNDGGYPFEFTLGERKVVAGWESALPKLRVGDHATLTLAPEFGYGETGDSDDIPPNATLIFKVESGVQTATYTRRRRDARPRRSNWSELRTVRRDQENLIESASRNYELSGKPRRLRLRPKRRPSRLQALTSRTPLRQNWPTKARRARAAARRPGRPRRRKRRSLLKAKPRRRPRRE